MITPLAGEPIRLSVMPDGQVFLDAPAFPPRALVADAVCRACPDLAALRYPYLTVRLANGRAVYRVATLDRGLWTGDLVEEWIAASAESPGDVIPINRTVHLA